MRRGGAVENRKGGFTKQTTFSNLLFLHWKGTKKCQTFHNLFEGLQCKEMNRNLSSLWNITRNQSQHKESSWLKEAEPQRFHSLDFYFTPDCLKLPPMSYSIYFRRDSLCNDSCKKESSPSTFVRSKTRNTIATPGLKMNTLLKNSETWTTTIYYLPKVQRERGTKMTWLEEMSMWQNYLKKKKPREW